MRGQVTLGMAASAAAALAVRYSAGRAKADRRGQAVLDARLSDLGDVQRLSILPLVERHTSGPGMRGEAGVSYLVRADDLTVLFDTGLGTESAGSALATNVAVLGVALDTVDVVVLSHLHPDHVGGARSVLRRTFSLGPEHPVPRSLTAFVPTSMTHPHADVCVVDRARVIGPGVAVLPPLERMLFWLGRIAEQALVVNVRGRGLVLISGCGHPPIERTLAVAEEVLDARVCAVVGGLHLPVHPVGSPLAAQAVLGNPNWPWRAISEADAREVIDTIRQRGPELVAVSGHDSTQWTMDAFAQVFGSRFRPVRVGEELIISAP